MLRNKGINKISELQTSYTPNGVDCNSVLSGFKALKLTESFSAFKTIKEQGYGIKEILSVLILIVVHTEKTVHSYLSGFYGEKVAMGKDVFYRLKNRETICWRMILYHIATLFMNLTAANSTTGTDKSRYLIFDDTTIEKSGKKDGVYRSGMGPCRKELDMNKINVAMKMFYSAVYRCIKIDYVLVDSWFTCDAFIQAVRSVKEQAIHLIGMYRIAKTKFEYREMQLTHAEINNRLGKPKRCWKLGYQYKQADVVYNGMRLTLFFSRRGKRDDWKVILTTDKSLSFIKVIEHYQVRWIVEVFFKETKSLLNLGRCQSSNFDAQIADATISMIAYILLSFRYRYDNYESMGALFRSMNADSLRQTLDRRLWGLFLEMIRVVADLFEIDADELLGKMLTDPIAEQRLTKMLGNSLKEAG
ncbi:IS4 family transposase ISDha5 [Bacteroidia bacterium]|nr:IS4 family transposase ISDha5 [Bacteroidia bacterium]